MELIFFFSKPYTQHEEYYICCILSCNILPSWCFSSVWLIKKLLLSIHHVWLCLSKRSNCL